MIRKHTPADLENIMTIWSKASAIAHPFLDSEFAQMVARDMRELYIPGSESWVYIQGEKPIGFISMVGEEIAGLFVDPDYQGHGVGTQLIDFIKPMFSRLEVDVFEENKIGRAFYKKYGFSQISDYDHAESGCKVLRLKYSGR